MTRYPARFLRKGYALRMGVRGGDILRGSEWDVLELNTRQRTIFWWRGTIHV